MRPHASAPRPTALRRALLIGTVVAAVVLVPLAGGAVHDRAAAAPGGGATRTSRMTLALRSQTYDAATHRWRIQVEVTLTSNAVCVPAVFDCIVGPLTPPSGVHLTDVACWSPSWNHLVVFRDHCMKQIGFAGFGQRFRFTYETDPSVDGTVVDLSAEFGRGVLPIVFQRLALRSLQVDLGSRPTLAKDCPEEVDAGQAVACTVTVTNPTAALTFTDLDLVDTPGGALAGVGALTQATGPTTFSCAGTTCADGVLAPGESATFDYAATAPSSPTGGDADNSVVLSWSGGGSPETASEPITIEGTGDTDLTVAKTTQQTAVAPGGTVTWTVTVTNTGTLPAADVDLADTVPPALEGATITYLSGVGTWTCAGPDCTTSTMPVGSATFTVTGTVSATAGAGSMVNEVGVQWGNDTYGPDYPVTAAAELTVDPPASTTTSTPTTAPTSRTPARLAFTG